MSGLLAPVGLMLQANWQSVAAASVDDVSGRRPRPVPSCGFAVIDDAAVTPKYLSGFEATASCLSIWRITKGVAENKLDVLLPAGFAAVEISPRGSCPC